MVVIVVWYDEFYLNNWNIGFCLELENIKISPFWRLHAAASHPDHFSRLDWTPPDRDSWQAPSWGRGPRSPWPRCLPRWRSWRWWWRSWSWPPGEAATQRRGSSGPSPEPRTQRRRLRTFPEISDNCQAYAIFLEIKNSLSDIVTQKCLLHELSSFQLTVQNCC